MIAAIAMIGTACCGPNSITRTGISIIDEPVPITPLNVPASKPTHSTSKYPMSPPGSMGDDFTRTML
ncbi:hypothetical protein [Paraburkholderia aspalathi]|uniref:hypothetical protein n=1 Tax=Paraburkholderia aspalathi TaxID=1324617 RepID=UPI0038BCF9A6